MEESYLLGAGCALLCYSIKLGFQDAACPRRLLEVAFASIVGAGAWHRHHHLPSTTHAAHNDKCLSPESRQGPLCKFIRAN